MNNTNVGVAKNHLFVFEGIDNSGKTTLSKRLADNYFNAGAVWSKEPVFSTEMADKLNSPDSHLSDAEREVLFLEGRIKQQELYNSKTCFLDRYLWTGAAYAKAFSPSIYEFCEALYKSKMIFKRPSMTFFIDTPVEICVEREQMRPNPDPNVNIERLSLVRQSYMDTMHVVDDSPILFLDGKQTPDQLYEIACKTINDILGR